MSMSGNFTPVTQGRRLGAVSVGNMRFTETAHAPNTYLPIHTHRFASVTFVLSGAFSESFGGVEHECEPLSLLFKPAGAEHANRYHCSGARSFIVELEPDEVDDLRPFADFEQYTAHEMRGTPAILALRAYDAFRSTDPNVVVEAEELVLELLQGAVLRLRATDPAPPPWLEAVRDRIEAEYEQQLSLATLASQADVHPVYLARQFRRHFRCSIGDHIRRCRIDHAADTLARDDVAAGRLALELGYYDQSHFNRAFKSETGLTPVAYRRRAQARTEVG